MKKILVLFLGVIIMFSLVACASSKSEKKEEEAPIKTEKTDGEILADSALAQAKLVYDNFWIDLGEGDVKARYFSPKKSGEQETAYLWPYMELAAMCARLMTILPADTIISGQKKLGEFYKDVVGGFLYYKTNRQDYTSYNSSRGMLPNFGTGDIYYDDNLWVAREYVNAYHLLKNADGTKNLFYLTEAEKVTDFVLSGWDAEHDGIRWLENTNTSYGITRNTCSNAPTVILLSRLYEETKKDIYLDWAKRVYNFTKAKLMDTDGTYFDCVKWDNKTGKDVLEKTKWTYNSGSMIAAGIYMNKLVFEESEKAQYLNDAIKTAEGSHKIFAVKFDTTVAGYPDTPWFNLLLLDGFVELYSKDNTKKEYIDSFHDTLKYAEKKSKDSEGFIAKDWVNGWGLGKDNTPRSLLDMASNAEILGLLSYAAQKLNYSR